jgi:hypothetical protein
MTRTRSDRDPKTKAAKAPPSRFAPKAFLAGSPETRQQLCVELAAELANRFERLVGTPWSDAASSIVGQLRASGHDLISLEDANGSRRWEAVWYHPRGTFSLLLCFRPPTSVEVTWQADDTTFTARA